MISIIVCSANADLLANLKLNISNTIGCPYEVLDYLNPDGKKGISEIYNQGAVDANFELLCFMHEDILIQTQNWGDKVLGIFSENPDLGLLGVAGGDYKSLAPSSWYNFEATSNFPGKKYINLIQGYKFEKKHPVHEYNNPKNEKLSRVVCVDGVWMCSRKSVFKKTWFDSELLQGFHGYDIDFSIAVNQNYDAAVTFDILIYHFSEGKSSREWVEAQIEVHKKWSNKLPINLTDASLKECMSNEKHFFRNFLLYAKSWGIPADRLKQIIKSAKASPNLGVILYLKLLWFAHKVSTKIS